MMSRQKSLVRVTAEEIHVACDWVQEHNPDAQADVTQACLTKGLTQHRHLEDALAERLPFVLATVPLYSYQRRLFPRVALEAVFTFLGQTPSLSVYRQTHWGDRRWQMFAGYEAFGCWWRMKRDTLWCRPMPHATESDAEVHRQQLLANPDVAECVVLPFGYRPD